MPADTASGHMRFERQVSRICSARWTGRASPLISPPAVTPLRSACSPSSSAVRSRRCIQKTAPFRSRVIMSRHGFGRGEYKYFTYPLPARRRGAAHGAVPASRADRESTGTGSWASTSSIPRTHAAFLKRCHRAGQTLPTPLLLQYQQDDYNCLHQDIYGEHVFPLQIAVLLSTPDEDFTGGEFVMTEQRPRMQTRPKSCR